ncbi:MAG: hypothetical protein Kow00127_03920 [Bacteroidales bacterium]
MKKEKSFTVEEYSYGQMRKLLSVALNGPLPGWEAHRQMASVPRRREWAFLSPPADAVKSAVLILFYPDANQWFFPLIVRPEYPGVHSRQVALPGGRSETQDLSDARTALREAEEEIGAESENIEIVGELSEIYIPPSNYRVKPVVGITTFRHNFVPDPAEVDEILEANLNILFDPDRVTTKVINTRYASIEAPGWLLNGRFIWGATAMILSELAWILRGN